MPGVWFKPCDIEICLKQRDEHSIGAAPLMELCYGSLQDSSVQETEGGTSHRAPDCGASILMRPRLDEHQCLIFRPFPSAVSSRTMKKNVNGRTKANRIWPIFCPQRETFSNLVDSVSMNVHDRLDYLEIVSTVESLVEFNETRMYKGEKVYACKIDSLRRIKFNIRSNRLINFNCNWRNLFSV